MNQREKNPENGHRRMVVSTVVIVVVLAVIVALAAVFIPRMRSNSSASGSSSQSQSQQSGSSSSDSKKQANTNSNSSQSGTVTTIDPSQKTLILYFSLTGTTQQAAESIHRLLPNADIVRIQPKEAYGDYDAAARRGDRERRNNIHPVPNIESYQNIFLGFPTWWQQPPMLIHTLFDNYDFSGKDHHPVHDQLELADVRVDADHASARPEGQREDRRRLPMGWRRCGAAQLAAWHEGGELR